MTEVVSFVGLGWELLVCAGLLYRSALFLNREASIEGEQQ